jgi:hypothetical protein
METVRMTQTQAWSSAYSTTGSAATAAATATATGSTSENTNTNSSTGTTVTTHAHATHRRALSSSQAIDTYAQTILEQHCLKQDTQTPDDSLGPYITSLLRASDIVQDDYVNVTQLEEFDSLLELLQEHCSMDAAEAASCLQKIATAVRTGHVPNVSSNAAAVIDDEYTMQTLRNALPENKNHNATSMATTSSSSGGVGIAAGLQQDGDDDDDDENFPPLSVDVSSSGTPSGGAENQLISPTQADTLIPFDLLGVLDDPSPSPKHSNRAGSGSSGSSSRISEHSKQPQEGPQQQQQDNAFPVPLEQRHQQQQQKQKPQDPFPPLGTPPVTMSRKKSAGSASASSKNANTKKASGHRGAQASELAAMLFRQTRPRISSIDEEGQAAATTPPDTSPNMTAQPTPTLQDAPAASTGTATSMAAASRAGMAESVDQEQLEQQQLQWNSVVEMLLSMNHDISEEVAGVAAVTADLDVNVAQYLIDEASSAPPVCRHLLTSGCYRSDCTFSHDVLGHTCVFWLRGRCGKGDSCRFLHGFNEKLLKDICTTAAQQQQQPMMMMMSSPPQSTYSTGVFVPPEHVPYSHPSASGMMHAFDLPQQQQVLSGGAYSSSSSSSYPKSGGFMGGGASWEPPAVTDASAGPPASSASAPSSSFSFANIASQGYNYTSSFPRSQAQPGPAAPAPVVPTVRIPQDLWNPHENRDSSFFYIVDPIERYRKVALTVQREDVLDLHFQSTKTFPVVLSAVLPEKLTHLEEVWIVMGTGHHVGSKTHQKGGGALESSVVSWLTHEGYVFARGRDRNGQGGAVLVKR